jgi:adenosine deaminase
MLTLETIRALPKISLHDHLDGGLRPRTIIDLSRKQGFELVTFDPNDLQDWIFRKCSKGTLEDYLEIFEITSRVMQDAESLTRIASEFVEDLVRDGVIYGECRWAPLAHTQSGLSPQEAVSAVSLGIEVGVFKARAAGHVLKVNQLLCVLRHEKNAQDVVNLAISNKQHGVVGVDLAGPEANFPVFAHRTAFKFAAQNGLGVTIHAGEGSGVSSVESAILDASATRLGHGVRIAEDIDTNGRLGKTAQLVKDSGVTLELAPTSNLQTGASATFGDDLASHPFNRLYRAGFRVTVSPDNRLMSNTSVSKELLGLVQVHNYSMRDLYEFQHNAIRAAFLGVKDKDRLLQAVRYTYGA